MNFVTSFHLTSVSHSEIDFLYYCECQQVHWREQKKFDEKASQDDPFISIIQRVIHKTSFFRLTAVFAD